MSKLSRGNVLAMALVLGLMTSALMYFYLSKQQGVAKGPKTIAVVVASQRISAGSTVSQEMLKMAEMQSGSVPVGTMTDINSIPGQVAKSDIRDGQPITLENVMQKNRLAYVIPPFMRAVTVAVDPVVGVGGFLKPGDRVDVVATFAQNDSTITKTVLQDVLLLATGADLTGNDSGHPDQQKPQTHATLAVVPNDAQKLVLADIRGKLRLTLRRPDDSSFVGTKGVTGREVIGAVPADNPERQSTGAAQVATKIVEKRVPNQNVPLFSQPPFKSTNETAAAIAVINTKTVQVVRGAKIEQVDVAK